MNKQNGNFGQLRGGSFLKGCTLHVGAKGIGRGVLGVCVQGIGGRVLGYISLSLSIHIYICINIHITIFSFISVFV
jgi:hypothetical protein